MPVARHFQGTATETQQKWGKLEAAEADDCGDAGISLWADVTCTWHLTRGGSYQDFGVRKPPTE